MPMIKRRIYLLKPSLVDIKSRMTLYKSVIIPQLSYACNALYEDDPKGEEIQRSCLYQCLKALLNIRGNVKRERLFWSLNLNINGKLKPKKGGNCNYWTTIHPNYKTESRMIIQSFLWKEGKLQSWNKFKRHYPTLQKIG